MNKEEPIEEFLRSFKASLSISFLYSPGHPYSGKFIEELKLKCDSLLQFLNPIKIGFTVDSLMVEDKVWSKKGMADEIAKVFHNRKIKSLEIRTGVTTEELNYFLGKLSLRPAEIFKSGGINQVISKEKAPHISIEDLDYSLLLKGEGEEVKDIWIYLLKEAVDENNADKINALANNFERYIKKFKLKDFLNNGQLQENVVKFIDHLQDNQKIKFNQCAKALFKNILSGGDVADSDIEKLKVFVEYLNGEHLADSLIEQITAGHTLDALNLKLFFKLIGEDKHKETANFLAERLQTIEHSPAVQQGMKELITDSSNANISEIYRYRLSSILDNIASVQQLYFDRQLLQKNYRFLLIDLLLDENNEERLGLIAKKLLPELEQIFKERDWDYIKHLIEALESKKSSASYAPVVFIALNQKIADFIESVICDGEISTDLAYLVGNISQTSKGVEFYLERIFKDKKVNSNVLRLFFKLFPDSLDVFNGNLDHSYADIELLANIMKSLKGVEYPQTTEVYKHIFYASNEYIKLEVLRDLTGFPYQDQDFLLSILRTKDILLKKEALSLLDKNEEAAVKAAGILLGIPSQLGLNNQSILENIKIIQDADLRQASEYLLLVKKRRFFWNKKVRVKAQEVLEQWNVR